MRTLLGILLVAACGSAPRPAPTPPTDKPPTTEVVAADETPCRDGVVLRGTKHAAACNSISASGAAPLDETKVDHDLRELYKTGLFEDVTVVVEPRGTGSVLVYELRDRPVIARVDIVGAPAGVTLPSHAPDGLADPVLIRRNADAMIEALQDAGYRRATVEHRLTPSDTRLVLQYTITPGARTVLGQVRFQGLDATREAAIRKQLKTQLGTPVLDEATQYDVIAVQTALYEDGLLNSRLSHEIVDAGEAKVDLVFTITEGPVFTLGTIRVTGPRAKAASAYAKAIAPLKRGTVARRSILVAAVKAIEAVHAGDTPVPIVIPQTNVKIDKKLVDFDFVVE